MKELSYREFLRTMPEIVVPYLPQQLQVIQPRQPFRWIVQFHFGEPRLHYEISRVVHKKDWELALHLEAKDKQLNRFILDGFRRHLFEIKDLLGETVEAEMWDKGWAKIYDVFPAGRLTADYQQAVGRRMAEIITCLHPFFIDFRSAVTRLHR